MRLAVIVACAATLAGAVEPDPAVVLKRVTARVASSSRRSPHYSCVQTVTREYYQPIATNLPRACSVVLEQRRRPTPDRVLRHMGTDRLRLDVTMAGSREIYSWVGASRFEEGPIDAVVRNGPIATGSFAGFLVAIFLQDVKTFTFRDRMISDGRPVMEYLFDVKQADSNYKVKLDNGWVFSAYSGTVLVDPQTDDVVRIIAATGELPPATHECQTIVTLDYQSVPIGDSRFLLPKRSQQRFIGVYGEETENTTTFSNCREYRGESTITYEEEPQPDAPLGKKRGAAAAPEIPPGSTFSFELMEPIRTDIAAAGDPFIARLTAPLQDGNRKVLAPKGTVLEGRLMRVQNLRVPAVRSVIALKPEALDLNGVKVPIAALTDWARVVGNQRRGGKARFEILLPLRGEDYSGVFEFAGEHVTVPKGFRSDWRTTAPVAATNP
jgi:hypothetical protein